MPARLLADPAQRCPLGLGVEQVADGRVLQVGEADDGLDKPLCPPGGRHPRTDTACPLPGDGLIRRWVATEVGPAGARCGRPPVGRCR